MIEQTAEATRLEATRIQTADWQKWGPYLSERQWGTVREDYSTDGSAWDYFTHDQARSRAYRWGEDGIAGISDRQQQLCFAIALWNGTDPILKERIFGLTGSEGNHGEDAKDYYFYLDSTPTHSYMKSLYKYPQSAFPYNGLVAENHRRSRHELEFELLDTGVFDENRYFDIFVEYAKQSPEDILIEITAVNRGLETKTLHLLPTLWFRNTWSWNGDKNKPSLQAVNDDNNTIIASHPDLGKYQFSCLGNPELLFTENETNTERLLGTPNASLYVKDGINNYIVEGCKEAVNPAKIGTKAAAYYLLTIASGESQTIQLRLSAIPDPNNNGMYTPLFKPFDNFEAIFANRQKEADEFYQNITSYPLDDELRNIQRQALAGMLWNKQYYNYDINLWLKGDSATTPVPSERKKSRNSDWFHFQCEDILSMCDKWEYPWFAAWDLAFHCIPLAMVDPEFAKNQLDLLTREWLMHPNGQIPAYEWSFSDVNPPVHAWATWRVYKIEQKMWGRSDRQFLERVFQKLLLNFTWWVNRKDVEGKNVFQGGFLGLDNIGVFDRSAALPTGGYLEQSDGTSWMGMYCLNMLEIALELAKTNPVYEDIATKFFEHFIYISDAMNHIGDDGTSLWDEEDGFYYDLLHLPNNDTVKLKVRSMVGLIPLFAVKTIESETLKQFPAFKARVDWFIKNRVDLVQNIACMRREGVGERRLLAIAYLGKLRCILQKMLDETEFLSPYGIRSISRCHAEKPYVLHANGNEFRVNYEPAESSSSLFGGNSNWRGPVWFPVNYLLIESLQKFHYYFGDSFQIECPTGSGNFMNLWEIASELSQRLTRIFQTDSLGQRPVYGHTTKFQTDPHWRDLILFYEYFHGDNGAGIGASHQTGWTGLVAKLIHQYAAYEGQDIIPNLAIKTPA